MIEFKWKGICVNTFVRMDPVEFCYPEGHERVMFQKMQFISADFLGYVGDDYLGFIAFAKVCFTFFIQSSWRSRTKNGLTRIPLNESMQGGSDNREPMTIRFAAKQKDNQHYLHIHTLNHETEEEKEVYLSVFDAMLLEAVMTKFLNVMQPIPHYEMEKLSSYPDKFPMY